MTRQGKLAAWATGGAAAVVLTIGAWLFGAPLLRSNRTLEPKPPVAMAPAERAPDAGPASPTGGSALDAAAKNATPPSNAPLPLARPFTWAAVRQGSEVRLTGHVPSEEGRVSVLARLRRELGDVAVVDETRVAAGYDSPVDFATAAGAVLGGLAHLRSGRVELADRTVRARGEAPDKEALAAVTGAFASLPRGLVSAGVAVTAAVVAPYVFSAERAPGSLILTGHVPDAEARAEIARQIRTRFFHEQVIDRTRLADGAPAAFTASAAFALEQLAQLATGEASVTAEGVRVTGDMLYVQAAEQTRERIARGVPGGARGFAEIRVRGQAITVRAEASP